MGFFSNIGEEKEVKKLLLKKRIYPAVYRKFESEFDSISERCGVPHETYVYYLQRYGFDIVKVAIDIMIDDNNSPLYTDFMYVRYGDFLQAIGHWLYVRINAYASKCDYAQYQGWWCIEGRCMRGENTLEIMLASTIYMYSKRYIEN